MARVERRSVVEVAVLEVAPGSRSLNGVVGIHKVVGEHRRERVDIMGVPGADSAVICAMSSSLFISASRC
jgi:hypothetical protein